VISGVSKGQQIIDSMVYTVYDNQYIFACRKATPIDLFKVANMYVSPENGYWGDVHGVPYNGEASTIDARIKERRYTNGNIFTTPTSVADTGMYKFYFYFTSSKGYCGVKNTTRFILNLYIGAYGCLESISGELDVNHNFCYGTNLDVNARGSHTFPTPITISDLLLSYSNNPINWKKPRDGVRSMDGDWVDIDVYSDRERRLRIGSGDIKVDLTPATPQSVNDYITPYYRRDDNGYYTTLYVVIHQDVQRDFSDSICIRIYPKTKLDVFYSPDIKNSMQEYDINDKITIKVDTSEYKFDEYTFMLNNKNLTNYYLGGNRDSTQITLSALVFSGIGDFITVIAKDHNSCVARFEDNVIVHVPFPSAFTPDGDGINDVFFGGDKYRNREFRLEISTRWGAPLYDGTSGWDGTYRGNRMPPGTYLYVLTLKLDDGTTRRIEGTVALIREAASK
jgi:gliding motility-associated-like protein